MRAIILAAGLGRRMLPLTRDTHKTLLTVGDRTIIDRLVGSLADNGVMTITVVTGYLHEQLERHLLDRYPHLDISFVRNTRYDETNNIYSLALAFEQIDIDDDLLLLESDLIFEPAVMRRLIECDRPNVALVDRYRMGLDGTVVTVSTSDVVTQVIPASLQDAAFDFTDKFKTLNLYRFSAEFCRDVFSKLLRYYTQNFDNQCYYELILGMLVYMGQARIHAEQLDGETWAEVDDPNDLRNAEYLFAPERRRTQLESSWGGYWNHEVLDFAFIRNMHFPPDSLVSQMRAYLPRLMENYGSAQTVLDRKLAHHLLCRPENVVLLNGAAQFFPTLRAAFIGKRVLLPSPTFGEYPRAFPGASVYEDRGRFDPDAVAAAARDHDLLVVVNPNNPTGTTARTADVVAVLDRLRGTGTTVVVDESFIDFSDEPSLVPILERDPRDGVVVLTSLSKSLGVPGLRIGYVYSTDPSWTARIRDDLPVWNMNSVAEHYVESLLKYPSELTASFERTKLDRDLFAEELRALPVVAAVHPSGGNFLLVELVPGAADVAELEQRLLVDEEILVKNVSAKFTGDRRLWRLAVRSTGENRRLCGCLRRLAPVSQEVVSR
ncbi:aminotransferase class I/II-fold pyridoxal phosphate-dependent enzyme [Pseudonocardia sp. DR1-2]|uniref:aminotransferase class I/II-fold pyridoxal phosphate-dependent enzyme n=1 Tax=Pseudonocardia sp. DR1-2 TaxID=2951168 RepID=UPI002043334D|nr:aminotransferase class I/II-fold pyridoxal phosphate-dependent enzyme [Pseudonocardia sp. DR1-2]MCM3846421.1 aminotransferase class I/II-fold pyridoxal phosphate-dependent enzyme [Pseudonocardia sp. DR1-2]